jgi:hypothetical protein
MMGAKQTYHPFSKIRGGGGKLKDPEAKLELCMEFLEESDLRCRRFKNNRDQSPFYNCNCLDILKDKKDGLGATIEDREFQRECITSYMCSFLDKSSEEKNRLSWNGCDIQRTILISTIGILYHSIIYARKMLLQATTM